MLTTAMPQPTASEAAVRYLITNYSPKGNKVGWLMMASILVEAWEQPAFAARHGRSRLGTLDWPPAAEVRSEVQVRVHRVADRAVFHAGRAVATDYVAARTF